MVRLFAITKSLGGLSYELGGRWVTIGRAPGNAFQIQDSSVSGQHCEVLFRDNALFVRDMRSTNGTYIRDTLVTEGVLHPGSVLRLGDVELLLQVSNEPSSFGSSMAGQPAISHSVPFSISPHQTVTGNSRRHPVLLVDDSMAFLEMAGEIFEGLSRGDWEVHRACGADQALSLMQQHPIKLAILDLNMPMLDGSQLLGMLHRRHPEAKLVVLTGHSSEQKRAECLAAGAELFLEKPVTSDGLRFVFNVINDLMTWKQREGFSGTLQQVALADVIQIECLRRNNCILEIRSNQVQGEIYLESGSITHAATAHGQAGESALHTLLSLNDGQFDLAPFRPPASRTIHGSWECLLMESARLRDEQRDPRASDKTTFLARPRTGQPPASAIISLENCPTQTFEIKSNKQSRAAEDKAESPWSIGSQQA